MAKTYAEHLEKCIKFANKTFKNFKAKLTQTNDVQIIDWRNKNDSCTYYIRFLFDKTAQTLTVSGDVGYGVFHFSEPATFEAVSKYSTLNYFISKLVCATDTTCYDEEYAFVEAMEQLSMIHDNDNEQIKNLAQKLADEADRGFEEDTLYELEQQDAEYGEWAYKIGQLPHIRLILWWQALKLIREQIRETKELSEDEQYLIYRNVLKNRVKSDIKRIATENGIFVSTEDIEAIAEKYVLHHEYNSDTSYMSNLQNLIQDQMDAKETFTVFAKIDARWSVNVKANTVKEVMQKIEKRFYAADFGDAYDIDYQVVNIETPDGKTINPQQ